jgi:hypothetical protein
MLTTRRLILALCAASISLTLLAPAAFAGEPATVTVRVQGLGGETLLPQTQVTTSATPIPVESGTCSGTSAGGALYDATHGAWDVKYAGEGVEILGIDGLDFPSFPENPGIYWAFWLNSTYAANGACKEEVSSGADIVFFAQCYETGKYCATATAPEHFLTMTAPKSRIVNVGEPVTVTVGSLTTEKGESEPTLPAGATVTAGSTSATPAAGGLATLSFAAAGTYTLQAQAPDSVASDQYTICVHDGNDGNCGTQAPAATTTTTSTGNPFEIVDAAGPQYTGPYALVAHASSPLDGHVYSRQDAPRILAGTVAAHSGVSSVSLELRREYRGRCFAYEGLRERFVKARCGEGGPFKVSTDGTFSYLLPAALAPGRYVLDIHATDSSGDRTSLARGTSRIVFYVH